MSAPDEEQRPDVTVVTPSFNMLPYLRLCRRSVADQEGVSVEHIVVDAVSTDGTPEWLRGEAGVLPVVERDRGMYDAVNKGLDRARGDVVAYLNCDEQYLPGTLRWVREYFAARPDVDVLFGSYLVVDPAGRLVAYRKAMPARWPFIVASSLYVFTCGMFLRRRVLEAGFRFDPGYRASGDFEFVVRLLRAGVRTQASSRYLSTFTWTGANLSADARALAETERARSAAPAWARRLRLPLNALRVLEKGVRGGYRERFPLAYSIHTDPAAAARARLTAEQGSWRWPSD